MLTLASHSLCGLIVYSGDADCIRLALIGSIVSAVRRFAAAGIPNVVRQVNTDTNPLAMPSTLVRRGHEILRKLEPLQQTLHKIPDLVDITHVKAPVSQVSAFPPGGLLGCDTVAPDCTLVRFVVRGGRLWSGGAIGSELCRQLLHLGTRRLVLFDRSEYALYSHLERLNTLFPSMHVATIATDLPISCRLRVLQSLAMMGPASTRTF